MRLREFLVMRAFGRPERGSAEVREKAKCGRWLIDSHRLKPRRSIPEIGSGPGVLLALLAKAIPSGRAVGVDPSTTVCAKLTDVKPVRLDFGPVRF